MISNTLKVIGAIMADGGIVLVVAVATLVMTAWAAAVCLLAGGQYILGATAFVLVVSSCFGGCTAGLMVVLLWPERSIFLTVFGVGLAWAAVLAEVKPWLQGTPIVWVALTAAILGALAAWWLSQHCRRLGVAT